ncbi:hypothetical protein NRIC_05500 [Enterococcus florum]|uniref:Uncharacterized protein n=1 Tax=Enterococcus florum TaxID=2480627 RepID=A0A4V0WP53_9ENTE|nr:hypothetical protein [Enterococcus florum]GCF92659.1 hypothetical protein NRIC_05500 [Enterococcus florum]
MTAPPTKNIAGKNDQAGKRKPSSTRIDSIQLWHRAATPDKENHEAIAAANVNKKGLLTGNNPTKALKKRKKHKKRKRK